jgi:tetrapyrrole methylase family protein/MazG family protein
MIPRLMPAESLLRIIRKLRGKGGCPWDRRQTHRSIRTNLIEETYEVIDAIDRDDPRAMKEELGDLLMQVVFHSVIEEQRGRFRFSDVVRAVCEKLVRRHPHVFARGRNLNPEAVIQQWERLKKTEKPGRGGLAGVPRAMPSILRAVRIQSKASRLGFEWRRREQALAKLEEEIREFREAVRGGRRAEIRHELGDVMFALVKAGRFLKQDPDDALQSANDRFTKRFHKMEKKLDRQDRKMHEVEPEELYKLWRRTGR